MKEDITNKETHVNALQAWESIFKVAAGSVSLDIEVARTALAHREESERSDELLVFGQN